LPLTGREEHTFMVCENRVLRRIFGLQKVDVAASEEDCIMRSFLTCTLHQMILEWSNQGWDGRGM